MNEVRARKIGGERWPKGEAVDGDAHVTVKHLLVNGWRGGVSEWASVVLS